MARWQDEALRVYYSACPAVVTIESGDSGFSFVGSGASLTCSLQVD